MNKKYLMNGFAALALIASVSSCTKDVTAMSQGEIDAKAKENAELQLGFSIPDGQTWNMASQVEANVNVNLKSGENYTVTIYSNDPIADGRGVVLAKEIIGNGETFTTNFTIANAKHEVVIGVTDQNDFTVYKRALIENGKLNVNFGGDSATARSNRSVTVKGDVYSQFNFPTQAEITAAFPTSVPSGAKEVADLKPYYSTETSLYNTYLMNGAGCNYQITKTNSDGSVSIGGSWQNGLSNIYNVYVNIDGNVTIKRDGNAYFNLYIIKGNVTLDSNYGQQAGIISIASGATLNDSRSEIATNDGIKIYNRGTLNATNSTPTEVYDQNLGKKYYYTYKIGNNASIYNEGIFNVEGGLNYNPGAKNTSFLVNIGDGNDETVDLSATCMIMDSDCHFYSSGKVVIEGETKVTQSGIVWINNGHYTTETMVFSAGNATFYNYCQLYVTDLCRFLDGSFNMMADSYAEINKGIFDNFVVNMHNNSSINITSGSKWFRQGQGKPQGFYAVNNATAYANLAGDTYIPSFNGSAIHVMGANMTLTYENLKFYNDIETPNWKNLFNYDYDDITYKNETNNDALISNNDGRRCWDVNDTGKYASSSNITIQAPAENQCTATIIEEGGPQPEDPYVYTYAFEDQTLNSDYDMNDVVLKVSYVVKEEGTEENAGKVIYDKTQLNVTLVALGATYEITAKIGKADLFEGKELHAAMGQNKGIMINTAGTGGNSKSGVAPKLCTVAVPAGWNGDFEDLPVSIHVSTTGKDYVFPNNDAYPHAVMIPVDWRWPTERTRVTEAYPKFVNWATSTADPRADSDWYNSPDLSKTMTNSSPAATN